MSPGIGLIQPVSQHQQVQLRKDFIMDNNQKVLLYFVGVLASFVVASLFHFVFGVGEVIAVTVCAITNLACVALPQRVDRRMPGGLRMFLFGLAVVACGLFGLMFMTWTLLVIYLVVAVAAVVASIATA